jgi:hypothetical protein
LSEFDSFNLILHLLRNVIHRVLDPRLDKPGGCQDYRADYRGQDQNILQRRLTLLRKHLFHLLIHKDTPANLCSSTYRRNSKKRRVPIWPGVTPAAFQKPLETFQNKKPCYKANSYSLKTRFVFVATDP